jgi:hypothetical protein
MFRLRGGKVPHVLYINRESREEALKQYCLVRSDMPKYGEYFGKRRRSKIFINYTTDTIYFVGGFPSGIEFNIWLRTLNKNTGIDSTMNITPRRKSAILQIALPFATIQHLSSRSRLDFIYSLACQHPQLKEILIVHASASFYSDKSPERFKFISAKGWQLQRLGTTGVVLRESKLMSKMRHVLGNFWGKPKGLKENLDALKKFKKRNPEWKHPRFRIVSLKKALKSVIM